MATPPCQAPFKGLQLLGEDLALRDVVSGYLGEDCELLGIG